MGALTAVLCKKGKKAVPKVVKMLVELQHRGRDMHGIATTDFLEISRSVDDLQSLDVESKVAIGHNLSYLLPKDAPQPIQDRDFKLAFEGRFFPPTNENEAQEIVRNAEERVGEKARDIIKKMDGSYAFAFLTSRRIILGRDPVGLTPLYYGEDDETYAFASERKALWSLDIQNVKSFPPGNLAMVEDGMIEFQPVRTITKSDTTPIPMKDAVSRLRSLLTESVNERILDTKRTALAFSGGLDSSLIAFFAKECDVDLHLITVGMEGQSETLHAEKVADFLGIPIEVRTFTPEDVRAVLSKVLWLVEDPSFLKTSVAIPFYWTAEAAKRIGLNVLLAGQGCDELFGGYYRYLREYASSGVEGLEEVLYHDVASSYEVNFERDNKVCAFHGVELRLPFADYDMIAFSLSLPVNLKIESPNDHLRKKVLRELARKVGLPSTVYNMSKKAIQYSTGIDRILRKLVKEERVK